MQESSIRRIRFAVIALALIAIFYYFTFPSPYTTGNLTYLGVTLAVESGRSFQIEAMLLNVLTGLALSVVIDALWGNKNV